MINFSHVQSMTPGALDHSEESFFKFPAPGKDNHNISLIKKSSNLSENKFIGSLDIREAFGGR